MKLKDCPFCGEKVKRVRHGKLNYIHCRCGVMTRLGSKREVVKTWEERKVMKQNETGLKRCPFCGENPKLINFPEKQIKCDCGIYYCKKENFMDGWQKRCLTKANELQYEFNFDAK